MAPLAEQYRHMRNSTTANDQVEMPRCECPEDARENPNPVGAYKPEERKAMRHAPNECPGDYRMQQVERHGKALWVCSACDLRGDRVLVGTTEAYG